MKLAYQLWEQPGNVLENVNNFLRSHFLYMPELIETLQTPPYMMNGLEVNNHLTGDCDDISTFHATLLTILDYKVSFVAIRSNLHDPGYDHVYIEVFDRESHSWIPFDITVPSGTTLEYFAKVKIAI